MKNTSNRKMFIQGIGTGLLTAVVLFGLMVAGPANALWNTISTSGWDDKTVTSKYLLDVKGYDVRVYEWAPADNPDARIVFVAGEKSSGVGGYQVR